MSKIKSLKICLYLTYFFLLLLMVFAVALPWCVTWYVEKMQRDASLPTIVMVTCYPCVPFAAGSLICLKRILQNIITDKIFVSQNVRYLKSISVFCATIAVVTLIGGGFYLPFYIVAGTFSFLSLLVFSLSAIFNSQVNKE